MSDVNPETPVKKRILITVKTIPTESIEYDETVCTAGITEDGEWIRIYPVPFRKLNMNQRYKKYQWIEAEVFRNPKDFRPESYKCNWQSIKLLDSIEDWDEKYRSCVEKMHVYEDFDELITLAKRKPAVLSLAVFKPKLIIGCEVHKRDISEQIEKQEKIKTSRTKDLFENNKSFVPAEPLPFKLTYTFTDSQDKKHSLMVEDWEVYRLFYRYKDDFDLAKRMVEEKYRELASSEHDTYFFVGTRLSAHYMTTNPFSIIGVFYPPKEKQPLLF